MPISYVQPTPHKYIGLWFLLSRNKNSCLTPVSASKGGRRKKRDNVLALTNTNTSPDILKFIDPDFVYEVEKADVHPAQFQNLRHSRGTL